MRILVTGGGTGGHIYPALAFIRYAKSVDPNTEVLYVGGQKGMENTIVPKENIPFKTIELQGFKRSLSVSNLKTVYLFLNSLKQAKKMIREFQPDVVIGTGGYVSGSVMYAAAKLKVPTIVHEQNSVPGVTNKFLAKYADVVVTSFEEANSYFSKAKRVELLGNPRAEEVANLAKSDILSQFQLDPKKKTVLIFGGSLGALKINEAIKEALQSFKEREYQILYASGERYYAEFEAAFQEAEKSATNIKILPYIHNMPEVLANVDLVVTRSGATTIAEITALGLPAIFVPSPYVTGDHQTKNANALVTKHAAKSITNSDLTGEKLVAAIDEILLDDATLVQMSKNAKELGMPNASQKLYELIQEIIGGR